MRCGEHAGHASGTAKRPELRRRRAQAAARAVKLDPVEARDDIENGEDGELQELTVISAS